MIFFNSHKDERETFVNSTLERFRFFRQIQILPVAGVFDFEGWMENFSGMEERYIAAKILSGFMYYERGMVNRLLYDAIGNVIADIRKIRKSNGCNFYLKEVIYSFIPGETPSVTDSGYLFTRKLRDDLGVPPKHIVEFAEVISTLKNTPDNGLNLVFCDDFVGSGCQCRKALNGKNYTELGGQTIYGYALAHGQVLAYAPLIANMIGYSSIKVSMPDLILRPVHVLGDEYNLFNPQCFCWNYDSGLFNAGVDLITEKCRDIGIPDNNSAVSMKGFRGQGLMIGFEHGIPDSDSAIFFCKDRWNPLMERYYERN